MKRVLIIGGGLAACTVARDLTYAGIEAWIIERSGSIGGKVRGYGCKATDKCLNCGLCTASALWEEVEKNDSIQKLCGATVTDIVKKDGLFHVEIKQDGTSRKYLFSDVVIASGFKDIYEGVALPEGVISGNAMEKLLKERKEGELFAEAPSSVAIVLCDGSRIHRDGAPWCSRYCCGFSGRTARVIKHLYPDCDVTMFYTDIRETQPEYCMAELKNQGINMVRCRARWDECSEDGKPVVGFEGEEGYVKKAFDKVILASAIQPGEQNRVLADLFDVKQDADGFLGYYKEPEVTGVYLAGAVKGPMGINETACDAAKTAMRIIEAYRKEASN